MAGSGASDAPVVVAYDGSPAARQAVVDVAKFIGGHPTLVVTVWEEGLAEYVPASSSMAPDPLSPLPPVVDPGVSREVDHQMHDQAERVAREGAALARSVGLDPQPLALPDEGNVARTILT